MSTQPVTMRQVRPFWGRVAVMESPVDEAQRDSGLIVPVGGEGSSVKRGVVLHIDTRWDDATGRQVGDYRIVELIPPGTPVYYTGGVTIGDVVLLNCDQIIAYEADE